MLNAKLNDRGTALHVYMYVVFISLVARFSRVDGFRSTILGKNLPLAA